ncbi:MAG: hypothetical protein KAG84_07190 [Bacteroidales bacterium]|nr:hypothetical protein [Bacteroidales bacterium]
MNTKIKYLGLAIVGLLIFAASCKKDEVDPTPTPETKYTGTLTVMQKDAYSDVAGRSSELWMPHTTTVFKWANDSVVQLNHGTAPGEVDSNGDEFLVVAKTYTFTGTKSQIEALQTAYEGATFDNGTSNKFLNLTDGTAALEKSFIDGIKDYISDGTNGFPDDGDISKTDLIALFAAGNYKEFGSHLPSFSWDKAKWTIVIETILGDILSATGDNLADYHVCNDDADLQVRLVKNFIATGNIEVPTKDNDGPMMYYTPE